MNTRQKPSSQIGALENEGKEGEGRALCLRFWEIYDLPSSNKTFPDEANYRFEIAGLERATTMEAMIDEAKKKSLPIHRAIEEIDKSDGINHKKGDNYEGALRRRASEGFV